MTCPMCRTQMYWMQRTENVHESSVSIEINGSAFGAAGLVLQNGFPGAKVKSIKPSSALYLQGLRTGDIILEIDHTPVGHHEYANDMLRECFLKQRTFRLRIVKPKCVG